MRIGLGEVSPSREASFSPIAPSSKPVILSASVLPKSNPHQNEGELIRRKEGRMKRVLINTTLKKCPLCDVPFDDFCPSCLGKLGLDFYCGLFGKHICSTCKKKDDMKILLRIFNRKRNGAVFKNQGDKATTSFFLKGEGVKEAGTNNDTLTPALSSPNTGCLNGF